MSKQDKKRELTEAEHTAAYGRQESGSGIPHDKHVPKAIDTEEVTEETEEE